MKKTCCALLCILMSTTLLLTGCGGGNESLLDPKNPVSIEIWHYYNGNQKQAFDRLVTEFNETVGLEQGIVVSSESQGSVNDLSDAILDSAEEKVGSDELPDIFASYADTAYLVNRLGLLTDIKQYMTEEELEEYIPAYLEEGELTQGELQLFPIAKSTELLYLNETAWNEFAQATGASKDALKTWEGIAETAELYYNWTDSETSRPGDGKTFFGRDAFANYVIVGSKQLGTEIFSVKNGEVTYQFDQAVFKRLWDNYCVPYLKGYFGAFGRFRSDDVKTGDIIACVASTSGASYFPTEVTNADGSTYPIESGVYLLPNFKDTKPFAVQQGAGMVVTKSTAQREYASTVFLKWFTDTQQNTEFSLDSGYLPVKKTAYDLESISHAMETTSINTNPLVELTVYKGVELMQNSTLYTPQPFENGLAARNIILTYMTDVLDEYAEHLVQLEALGMTREEALGTYVNDELFQQWLNGMETAISAL